MGFFDPPNIDELKHNKNIKGLIKALKYKGNWTIRQNAAQALADIGGSGSVKPLIKTLCDSNLYVRKAAADALKSLGWNPSCNNESVLYWIAKEDWDEIVKCGSDATKSLIEYFDREFKEDLLESAASALFRIGDDQAMKALTSAIKLKDPVNLGNKDRAKCKAAVRAFEGTEKISQELKGKLQYLKDKYENKDTKETTKKTRVPEDYKQKAWVRKLQSKHKDVRLQAMDTEGLIVTPEAIDPLIDIFMNKNKRTSIEEIKAAAILLAKIGKPVIKPLIISFLKKPISAKITDINAIDANGNTTLMLIIDLYEDFAPDLVHLFIEYGADVNVKSKFGNTALMMAVNNGAYHTVKMLIKKGADVNANNGYGVTALMMASYHKYYNIESLLLENGADASATDKEGNTYENYAYLNEPWE